MLFSTSKRLEPQPENQRTGKISQALQNLKESVDSDTLTLVNAFNAAHPSSADRLELLEWLKTYVEMFEDGLVSNPKEIQSYALLANVKYNSSSIEERKLVASAFVGLCRKICADSEYEEIPIFALDYMLNRISGDILKEVEVDWEFLANRLLDKISPSEVSYHLPLHRTLLTNLFALQQILRRLYSSKDRQSAQCIQQRILEKLVAIEQSGEDSQRFFYLRVINISVKAVEEGVSFDPLLKFGRCLFHITSGGFYEALELQAIKEIRFDSRTIKTISKWLNKNKFDPDSDAFVELTSLFESASEAITNDNISYFWRCFEKSTKKLSTPPLEKSRKIVGYGLILLLRLLGIQDQKDSRAQARNELRKLRNLSGMDTWVQEPDIQYLLIDVSNDIDEKEDDVLPMPMAVAVLNRLCDTGRLNDLQKRMFGKEKYGPSKNESDLAMIEERLAHQSTETKEKTSTNAMRDPLFLKSRQALGMTVVNEDSLHIEYLKRHYRRSGFAEVYMMLKADNLRHVNAFEFSVRFLDKSNLCASDEVGDPDHHFEQECRWKCRFKELALLEELFDPRIVHHRKFVEPISKILLLGNSGIGKTSLIKNYACRWANNQIETEFRAVYVLPFKKMTQNGSDMKSTLSTAMANLYFPYETGDDRYQQCCETIKIDLEKPTTLLILDDVEEVNDVDFKISEVFELNCKILLTGRPYNLDVARQKVDIEMECIGLNDRQLENFFIRELPQSDSKLLMKYLRGKPKMLTIAHDPWLANAFSLLWKANERNSPEEALGTNENEFCKKMAQYSWDLFSERASFRGDAYRYESFAALEHIAFECQNSRRVLVDKELIFKCTKTESSEYVLRQTNFPLLRKRGNQFEFLHPIFVNHFAGLYVSHYILQRNISRATTADAMTFLSNRKYEKTNEAMFSFMTQETAQHGLSGLNEIFSIIDRKPIAVLEVQHVLLKIKLLEAFLLASINTKEVQKHEECIELVNKVSILPLAIVREPKLSIHFMEFLHQLPNTLRLFPRLAALVLTRLQIANDSSLSEFSYATSRIVLSESQAKKFMACYEEKVIKGEYSVFAELKSGNQDQLWKEFFAADVFFTKNEKEKLQQLGIKLTSELLYQSRETQAAHFFWDLLSTLCSSDDVNLRQNAAIEMSKAAKLLPQRAPAALKLLFSMLKDDDRHVRRAAAFSIPEITHLLPHTAIESVDNLSLALMDQYGDVRRAAASSISGIVGSLMQDSGEEIFANLSTMLENPEWAKRQAAVIGISEIRKKWPQKTNDVLGRLFSGIQDDSWKVRYSSADGILEFVESLSQDHLEIVDLCFLRLKDNRWFINEAAIRCIPKIIKRLPENAAMAFEMLLGLLSCDSSDLGKSAIHGISQIAIKTKTTAFEALEKLSSVLLESEDESMLDEAISGIGEIAETSQRAKDFVFDLLDKNRFHNRKSTQLVVSKGISEINHVVDRLSKNLTEFASTDGLTVAVRRRATVKGMPQTAWEAFQLLYLHFDDEDKETVEFQSIIQDMRYLPFLSVDSFRNLVSVLIERATNKQPPVHAFLAWLETIFDGSRLDLALGVSLQHPIGYGRFYFSMAKRLMFENVVIVSESPEGKSTLTLVEDSGERQWCEPKQTVRNLVARFQNELLKDLPLQFFFRDKVQKKAMFLLNTLSCGILNCSIQDHI